MPRRPALNEERIIEAAARVADRGGIAQVSMRNVGRELGVEAMSLYHHLAGKDALLDGLADWIFTRIELPEPRKPWRPAMADRAASARGALATHPWALGVIESRSPGPALLSHHEAVLACLRHNGFSIPLAAHASSAIDAYVYGFVLTELNLPFDADESVDEFVGGVRPQMPPDRYPHLAELVADHVMGKDYTYGGEFAFGLDLILDSLERHLAADTR
ncbi:TetR/AcrR family transcriptional regulator C-terminal domain-containing protein [Nocardiopsis sp. N85]|uniref:TetR/AcrR family transcriptional regulator C-terminal domain-containing protein n=1 Tax=Nocardiopsis sp. N85 TaxID=3029400 RepID=UPI00237EEB05|nr:TetR/AcrR family transcriptional regulator C-terminal domain-containing protein [Nocardiopsis sp. N85]MDE3722697.1 TetR/AcrR family transcriptional regulator C-terminal domain-containing protein [Nocardiopsis sp. N85]